MPRRNLTVILLAALLSLMCYHRASRNRFAATFAEAMNHVTAEYVDEVEPRALFEGAMEGMMDQLDMYSGYTSPQEKAQFDKQLDGEFPGVGFVLEVDEKTNRLTILSPLVGTPAQKAGLQSGDVILAINGHEAANLTLEQAIDHIKGPVGSKVKLLIERGDVKKEYELEREIVYLESVQGDIRRSDGTWMFRLVEHPRIGYLRVTNFGKRTEEEFKAAIESFDNPGEAIDGLIIDFRGNSGGLLSAAVGVCDMLLDEGLIVSTRGRNKVERASYSAWSGTELSEDIPIVVIVDRSSASASEIVAACLQDHKRAVVVGQRTWGKGTVQNVIDLEGGKSAIRFTIATYWRPSGKDIHKRRNSKDSDDWGVRPDPGLEVILTKPQFEKMVKSRQRRDMITFDDLAKAKREIAEHELALTDKTPVPGAPPIPVPDPADEAAESPFIDDPQLDKAVEYLQGVTEKAKETH